MDKLIGFCGAHRVGKTTLAMHVANASNIMFIKTSVSILNIWKDFNIKPDNYFTFAERIELQYYILDYFEEIIQKYEYGVFDRTPMDLIGYLLANIDSTCSGLFNQRTKIFIDKCVKLTEKFDKIFFVYPKLDYIPEENKSNKTFISEPYIRSVSNNILSECIRNLDKNKFVIVPEQCIKIKDRTNFVLQHIEKE